MKVCQHIPNFFSGFPREVAEIDSLEDLQALEFVRRFTSAPEFHRLSLHRNYDPESQTHLLMSELDEGKRWYVVAYLSGDPSVLGQLPEWTGAQ